MKYCENQLNIYSVNIDLKLFLCLFFPLFNLAYVLNFNGSYTAATVVVNTI